MGIFEGRTLHFATMHEKESIVSGKMQDEFGIHVCVAPINTDLLGTFSGETERPADALSTARMKIERAREISRGDLFLASEGSFGPHPAYGILPCNEEWLVLLDVKYHIEIVAHGLYLETNFNQRVISDETQLLEFAVASGFPQHGILLRGGEGDSCDIEKGIRDKGVLVESFRDLHRRFESVTAETDMRSMMNPTRRENIYKLTADLISRMKSHCPECTTPGWAVTTYLPGLPCSWCGMPTRSSLYSVYSCVSCTHSTRLKFPHGKEQEDPMYCDQCNP